MSILSDELANDPQGLGYATPLAEGDHQEVARLLNEPRYTEIGAREIGSRELLVWGGQSGRMAALRDAAESHADAGARSVADVALRMIQRSDTTLDLSDPVVVGMVDALVSAGVFGAADKSSLETLSTTDISRARQLGLGTVTHQEVRNAAP